MGRTRDSGVAKAAFRDRREAGRRLAEKLARYANGIDVIVLALPRGGVPVGFEVAEALRAPLDVFLVRKLGLPGHEELAVGAVASGGVPLVNAQDLARFQVSDEQIQRVIEREKRELARRERAYRGDARALDVRGKTVVLVDDGLATGSSMQAAVIALRQHDPARLVVAVPVAPPEVCDAFRRLADEVVCPFTPKPFRAVSEWYEDFAQTTDDEVRRLLGLSRVRAEVP
jgi:predicted phosphoribosyltransferase